MAQNILSDYLDLNKCFEIHTNEIDFQQRAVIIQEGKLMASYSIKVTRTKKNTGMEKELIRIIETLK